MLMLRPVSDEYTPRDAHERWYQSPDGKKWSVVSVNDMGVVECTEEVLDHLLTAAGYVEGDAPAWARLAPRRTPDHRNERCEACPDRENGSRGDG